MSSRVVNVSLLCISLDHGWSHNRNELIVVAKGQSGSCRVKERTLIWHHPYHHLIPQLTSEQQESLALLCLKCIDNLLQTFG